VPQFFPPEAAFPGRRIVLREEKRKLGLRTSRTDVGPIIPCRSRLASRQRAEVFTHACEVIETEKGTNYPFSASMEAVLVCLSLRIRLGIPYWP